MKLLVITPSTILGGAEKYMFKIATAATQAGWKVHVAFPKSAGLNSLIEDVIKVGIHYHCLKIAETEIPDLTKISQQHQALIPVLKQLIIPRIKFDLSIVLHFFRTLFLLIKLKPDVVMINLTWADHCLGSILACSTLNIPTSVNFHCIPFPLSISKIKLMIYHWAYHRRQKWITISQNYRGMIAKSFQIPFEQILCIYNGIKTKQNKVNISAEEREKMRLELRQELGFSKNTKIILTVARLSDEKGHDFFIPAIPHLKDEFPDLKFVWVGDGNKRDKLIRLVQDYNITNEVRFLGFRTDIPRLLQASDLFVFPTNFEGLPFALLEAMTYGIPVIATNTHGVPEVIEHQVHGLLTRKGDSCNLLEAIRWALSNTNKMQAMAENGKRRVEDFSQEQMLKETLEILENLADNRE